jgi:hypothetical protein
LKQDYQTLCHALADYPADVIAQALRVLQSGAVYRSEKALGVAQWAADLHCRLEGKKGQLRSNIIWAAVAAAPAGFCHLRSTVISTLLDDIKAGMDFDSISRRWKDKLHPLQYQRPTAAPTAGVIAAAEKAFEATGAAKSLERRFATTADILKWEWQPKSAEATPEQKGGLFDHLRPKSPTVKELDLPPALMTVERFRRDILPTATGVEVQAPSSGPYYGLLTAAHPDSPPILQWDGLEGCERNPVSWYFYSGGSTASNWHLSSGWVECSGVFLPPHQWRQPEKFVHQGLHLFFALKGCWDGRVGVGTGLCLFPETLRSEYHSVRSVIEAHSRKGTLPNPESGTANGVAIGKGSGEQSLTVRVTTAGGRASYRIDRWE